MKPVISDNCRIRYPEHFSAGDFSIVDDFSYFSTRVRLGRYNHIGPGCTIAGGKERLFSTGDFCGIASGVRVYCTSDDYSRDLITIVPPKYANLKSLIQGDVRLGDFCGIGANSVVMPDNFLPEGTAIGALSFVPSKFEFQPWSVYMGVPVRLINRRDKASVMSQADEIEGRK
jgi:acetyltransferase-like isoleucine patch superfamily enzyme